MNNLPLILGLQISLVEIIIFQLGAVILGFAIHFFITSKKNIHIEEKVSETAISDADQWRLKYYEELDMQEKKREQLQRELEEARESEEQLEQELADMRAETRRIVQEAANRPAEVPAADYLENLKQAQHNLFEHNHRINLLLEQIEVLKDTEQKHLDTLKANEQLNHQLRDLRKLLTEKETEIKQIRQQSSLSREMNERLDRAYGEFNSLQDKIQKVETYLVHPQHRNFEFEELQQSYFKLTKDFDEMKLKFLGMMEENQRLTRLLADAEDKLRESNFQRQQLMKKVGFLEELNNDLQQVAEHNKKLENQLRRIGEIESMLARVQAQRSEEPGQ
jgi:cellobiose-specific phosphotransferase system component IIB